MKQSLKKKFLTENLLGRAPMMHWLQLNPRCDEVGEVGQLLPWFRVERKAQMLKTKH